MNYGRWAQRAPARRTLIAAIATTAVAATTLVACGSQQDTARDERSAAQLVADWTPVSGLPLTEPVQLHARRGVLRVDLTARRGTVEVSGADVTAQPFNGQLVGPTLHVSPGDTLDVTFRNGIDADTNIHYHGLHVRPTGLSDNVFRTFEPGDVKKSIVRLPKDHAPGTYWYHVHLHGLSEGQLMGGLSGLLVVDGLKELLPRPLRKIRERQLAIRNLQTKGSAVVTDDADVSMSAPSAKLVNGLLKPSFSIASGETQLWRLGNIGADLFYDVKLAGHRMTVIAEDGSPVWRTSSVSHLKMAPGKRFDVLVQGGRPGRYLFETMRYGGGFDLPQADLAEVTVTGPAVPASRLARLPKRIATPMPPIAGNPVARRRSFTFSFGTSRSGGFQALINREVFDAGTTDVAPVLGTTEEWTLINRSEEEHPFHIHVNDFQVMSINGRPYRARGMQDVVVIPVDGRVVVRNPFDDFTGHYVFHCHILGHEDAGMMQTVEVVRRGQRPTPPPGGGMAHHLDHGE